VDWSSFGSIAKDSGTAERSSSTPWLYLLRHRRASASAPKTARWQITSQSIQRCDQHTCVLEMVLHHARVVSVPPGHERRPGRRAPALHVVALHGARQYMHIIAPHTGRCWFAPETRERERRENTRNTCRVSPVAASPSRFGEIVLPLLWNPTLFQPTSSCERGGAVSRPEARGQRGHAARRQPA
jgi:hypothetical protein